MVQNTDSLVDQRENGDTVEKVVKNVWNLKNKSYFLAFTLRGMLGAPPPKSP